MDKKRFKRNLILMIILLFFIISLEPIISINTNLIYNLSDLKEPRKGCPFIENDTFSDIIVASYRPLGKISVLLGNGTGGFNLFKSYNFSSWLMDLVAADFNEDGLLDLAVPDTELQFRFCIFLGEGCGLFGDPIPFSTTYIVGFGITCDDFNKDGNIDVALTCLGGAPGNGAVDVFLGNGNGSFEPKLTLFLLVYTPIQLKSGYFNNDSFLDLAIVSDNYDCGSWLTVAFGNGTGQFYIDQLYELGNADYCVDVNTGDFNLDGFLDLAVPNFKDNDIRIFYNNGSGKFQTYQDYYTGEKPKSVISDDFNLDGNPDLAVTIRDKVSILLNNGEGEFNDPIMYDVGHSFYESKVLAHDFNGDNLLDLVVTNKDDDTITILFGFGNGTFGDRQDFPAEDGPYGIVVGNFNPILPPTANFTYTPKDPTISDLIHFNDTSTSDDGTIVSWLWDFGDGNTSIMQHPTHQYFFPGIYSVKLKVTDNFGLTNNVSKEVEVNNSPPSAPNISGPVKCIPKIKYKYTFMSTTPLNIDIYYYIDWGDNTVTDWIGPFASGQIVTINHTWNSKGSSYIIKSRAKDIENLTSPWSEYSVSTPRNKATIGSLFLRILEKFPLLKRLFVLI
jgi:PKD repeat protein